MTTKPTITERELQDELNSNHIYRRDQIQKYTKFSRFGYFDPYNTMTVSREYVFFTKPDLHLFSPNSQSLNPEISNIPFFINCYNGFRDSMNQLQWSTRYMTDYSPFCNLLTNTVNSALDLSDVSIEKLETSANAYGVKIDYPLATPLADSAQDFTLEFKDNKHLDVYMFFRIWYEYEKLKAKGLVSPPDKSYILNKVLHDQMSVYKIIVGEDMETIIHWTKFWGVYPTSIPRSAFGEDRDGPLSFSVSFTSQFMEDMEPTILSDFNAVAATKKGKYNKDIPIYKNDMVNGEWCNVPHIVSAKLNGRSVYKLKWR